MLPRDKFSNSWVIEISDDVFLETWSEFEAKKALEEGFVVRTAFEHLAFANESFRVLSERLKEEEK